MSDDKKICPIYLSCKMCNSSRSYDYRGCDIYRALKQREGIEFTLHGMIITDESEIEQRIREWHSI